MSQLVLEPDLAARFDAFDEPVELLDQSGRRIGFYHPSARPSSTPRSPLGRDSIEARRLMRDGSPLADVLGRLSSQR